MKPNLNVHAAPYIPYPYQMYANPYLTCVPPPNNTQVSSSAITLSTTQQGTANVNQVQFTNSGALHQAAQHRENICIKNKLLLNYYISMRVL